MKILRQHLCEESNICLLDFYHQHLMVAQSHGVKVKSIVELGNNSPLELGVPGGSNF